MLQREFWCFFSCSACRRCGYSIIDDGPNLGAVQIDLKFNLGVIIKHNIRLRGKFVCVARRRDGGAGWHSRCSLNLTQRPARHHSLWYGCSNESSLVLWGGWSPPLHWSDSLRTYYTSLSWPNAPLANWPGINQNVPWYNIDRSMSVLICVWWTCWFSLEWVKTTRKKLKISQKVMCVVCCLWIYEHWSITGLKKRWCPSEWRVMYTTWLMLKVLVGYGGRVI